MGARSREFKLGGTPAPFSRWEKVARRAGCGSAVSVGASRRSGRWNGLRRRPTVDPHPFAQERRLRRRALKPSPN